MEETEHLIPKVESRTLSPCWKIKLSWRASLCLFLALATTAFVVIGVFGTASKSTKGSETSYQSLHVGGSKTQSAVGSQKRSNIGRYSHAAVAADTPDCASIGSTFLAKTGASTVDAAIATLLCTGLENAHSSGIGGGSVFLIYDVPKGKQEKELIILDSRETAPAAASTDMFMGGNISSESGGLSVAVPGAVRGYYEAWKRFGRLPWADLFQPAIRMARYGFPCVKDLADNLQKRYKIDSIDPELRSIFVTEDGNFVKEGDTIRMPKLADTLDILAKEGPGAFYTGSLALDIVKDIQEQGGIFTSEDLHNYTPVWRTPTESFLPSRNWTMYSAPPPFSGPVLQFMLHILEGYKMSADSLKTTDDAILTYHRIIEAFKFAYAERTHLGDPAYENVSEVVQKLTSFEYADFIRSRIDDNTTHDLSYYDVEYTSAHEGGTSHLNFLGIDGSVVSVTDTINRAWVFYVI